MTDEMLEREYTLNAAQQKFIELCELHEPMVWRFLHHTIEMCSVFYSPCCAHSFTEPVVSECGMKRPVLQAEIDAGLNVYVQGESRKDPVISHHIDAVFDFLKQLESYSEVGGTMGEKIFIFCIAQEYYDCLSDGMDKGKIDVVLALIDAYPDQFDMNTCIYDGGPTLGDWVDEVRGQERVLSGLPIHRLITEGEIS